MSTNGFKFKFYTENDLKKSSFEVEFENQRTQVELLLSSVLYQKMAQSDYFALSYLNIRFYYKKKER